MGQIPRSTERISSYCMKYQELSWSLLRLYTVHFWLIRGSTVNLNPNKILEFIKEINSVGVGDNEASDAGRAGDNDVSSPVSAGSELHATGQILLGPVPRNFLVANVTRKSPTSYGLVTPACYEEVTRKLTTSRHEEVTRNWSQWNLAFGSMQTVFRSV